MAAKEDSFVNRAKDRKRFFFNEILFRRFGDRYDEFGDYSFMKSYQESELFLMVKFEYV